MTDFEGVISQKSFQQLEKFQRSRRVCCVTFQKKAVTVLTPHKNYTEGKIINQSTLHRQRNSSSSKSYLDTFN